MPAYTTNLGLKYLPSNDDVDLPGAFNANMLLLDVKNHVKSLSTTPYTIEIGYDRVNANPTTANIVVTLPIAGCLYPITVANVNASGHHPVVVTEPTSGATWEVPNGCESLFSTDGTSWTCETEAPFHPYDAIVGIVGVAGDGGLIVAKNRYGQKISSGISQTNDVAVIQAVIDAGYKNIKLSGGEYHIDSSILIRYDNSYNNRGVSIFGDGCRHNTHAGYGTFLKATAALSNGMFYIYGTYSGWKDLAHIQIEDMSLDGNARSVVATGINAYFGAQLGIKNVRINDFDGYGILVDKFDYLNIEGCQVNGCGNIAGSKPAVEVKCTVAGEHVNFATIHRCDISADYYAMVKLSNLYQWEIANCYFEEGNTSYDTYGIIPSHTGTIRDNLFFAGNLGYSIYGDVAYDFNIANNKFVATGIAGGTTSGAIKLHNCSRVSIQCNKGIDLYANFLELSDDNSWILVEGNQIFGVDTTYANRFVTRTDGQYNGQVDIINNTCRTFALGIIPVNSCFVVNNRILACTVGISFFGSHEGGRILENDFTDCGSVISGTPYTWPSFVDNIGYGWISGSTSGTGLRTIAHSLGRTPAIIRITPTGSSEVAPTFRADATNVYVNCSDEPFNYYFSVG